MAATTESERKRMKNPTTTERKSERELVVTRTCDAPARLVFDAWTKPELFQRWWVPKSFPISMIACEMDVRTGGGYRLVFEMKQDPSKPMPFFGKYTEVVPQSRLVWTNDEAGDAGQVTTVTFEDLGGRTRVVLSERYPSKEALDEAKANGSLDGTRAQFEQLEEFITAS